MRTHLDCKTQIHGHEQSPKNKMSLADVHTDSFSCRTEIVRIIKMSHADCQHEALWAVSGHLPEIPKMNSNKTRVYSHASGSVKLSLVLQVFGQTKVKDKFKKMT